MWFKREGSLTAKAADADFKERKALAGGNEYLYKQFEYLENTKDLRQYLLLPSARLKSEVRLQGKTLIRF